MRRPESEHLFVITESRLLVDAVGRLVLESSGRKITLPEYALIGDPAFSPDFGVRDSQESIKDILEEEA